MKLIHSADLHLGSKIDSRFPRELARERKEDVRNTFRRMVEYAEQNDVKVILLAGDVFDSDDPFKKDKAFFYSVVEKHPEIDFLYLRGNHDCSGDVRELANLKRFSTEWTSYIYENVVISGIETVSENATSLYSTLSLDEKCVNIVMLHGQVGERAGIDRVQLSKLCEKHIDYLALGHIHKYEELALDKRGVAVYCGCPEGRGFDETGDKGFVLLETGEGVKHRFIPFSEKKIVKLEVDASSLEGAYEISRKVRPLLCDPKGIYRVELLGEVGVSADDVTADLEKYLSASCAYISVKDRRRKKLDIHAYDGDLSLKGEFVRTVMASADYTAEEKLEIIAYGLRALSGEEVEV